MATIQEHFGTDLAKLTKAEIIEHLLPYRPHMLPVWRVRENFRKHTKGRLLRVAEGYAANGARRVGEPGNGPMQNHPF